MNRIARFEKVSKEKFFEGWKDTFETAEEKEMEAIYESLKLPGRATAGSGYQRKIFTLACFQLLK